MCKSSSSIKYFEYATELKRMLAPLIASYKIREMLRITNWITNDVNEKSIVLDISLNYNDDDGQ